MSYLFKLNIKIVLYCFLLCAVSYAALITKEVKYNTHKCESRKHEIDTLLNKVEQALQIVSVVGATTTVVDLNGYHKESVSKVLEILLVRGYKVNEYHKHGEWYLDISAKE